MNVDKKKITIFMHIEINVWKVFHTQISFLDINIEIQLFSYIVQFKFKINHFIPIIFNYYYYYYYSPFLIE